MKISHYLKNPREKNLFDFFAILTLLILGYKYLYGFERFIDIALYDESNYLDHGINLIRSGFPNAQLSPFYSAWYYFLSLFQSDNVKLYYLNYELLTICLPISIYYVLRRYLVPFFPSFLISLYFLISYTNFASFPKVSHFAIILILLSFIIATYYKSRFNKMTVALIGSFLISYVRPEFFISFLAMLSLYVIMLAYNFKSLDLKKLYKISAGILIIVINLSLIGLPISSGERSFLAFSQHFSLNWVSWEKSNLSPWSITNCNEIIHDNFNNSKSILECCQTNPKIFMKHLEYNETNLPGIFATQLQHSTLIFPDTRAYNKLEFLLLVLAFCLFALSKVYSQGDNFRQQLKNNFHNRKELWLFIVIYSIPLLISTIIIYPREHYLTMLIVLITILIITLIFSPENKFKVIPNTIFLFVLGFSLFFASPNLSALKNYSDYKPNLTVINYLKSLKISGDVNVLESEGGYNIYAGSNYHRVAEDQKKCGFDEFIQKFKINMILLGGRLQHDERFDKDRQWKDFLSNYKDFGFIKKTVPNSGFELLMLRNLK